MTDYGKELLLDLHECNPTKFNRRDIKRYFKEVCELIDMQRQDVYFWDDVGVPKAERQTEPHLVGTSAIQFILTSNITIHTLDIMKNVYLNIFSCKEFDAEVAAQFSCEYFQGIIVNKEIMRRV